MTFKPYAGRGYKLHTEHMLGGASNDIQSICLEEFQMRYKAYAGRGYKLMLL